MVDSGEEAGARQAMRVILDMQVGGIVTASCGSSVHTQDQDA